MRHIPKPEPGEYDPYAIEYFNFIPDDGMVIQHLADNAKLFEELVTGVTQQVECSTCRGHKLIMPNKACSRRYAALYLQDIINRD